jgi:hypothetical protein
MRTTLYIVCLLTIMPLVLWLTIAAIADSSDYLALLRSGFLLLGLSLGVGWGLLRNKPRLVFLGLGLALLGYLTFAWASGYFFHAVGYGHILHDPIPWAVRYGFGQELFPGFRFGEFAALALIFANLAMVQKRFGFNRIALNNALLFGCVFILAGVLGAG